MQKKKTILILWKEIVADKELALFFRSFLHKHFNNENFSFWLEVEQYRNLPSDNLRKGEARKIASKYFEQDGHYELNVESSIKKDILKNLENPPVDLFDEAQQATWNLMSIDCVPKFVTSEDYESFLAGKPAPQMMHLNAETFGRRTNTIRLLDEYIQVRPGHWQT